MMLNKCKSLLRHVRTREWVGKAAAVLLAISSLGVLLSPVREGGLRGTADTMVHVGNVVESSYLLEHKLPPWDWLPDIGGGYGGPNYLYYGSLSFLAPAALVRTGLSAVGAIRLWIVFTFVLAGFGSYLWCSTNSLSKFWGVVGSVFYVWGPYFFGLPYVRGAYPEFFAAALYPLLFLPTFRTSRGGFWRFSRAVSPANQA